MCGIAGIFTLARRPTSGDAAVVLRMLDAQVHRGPDDWGLLVPESLAGSPALFTGRQPTGEPRVRTYHDAGYRSGAVLGARRLAILDLSPRAGMPMGTTDGRWWLTYNGESYNYRELRQELQASGEPFRTDSDTEVVLRGWEAWGDRVVTRLQGMFAFAALQCGPEPRLLLARDRFGIKPLYYYRDGERLIFASEVRALLRSGLVPDEPNTEATTRFLQLGSVPAPLTTVKDVLALPAGCTLAAEPARITVRSYWGLAAHLAGATGAPQPARAEAVATTRALLEDSVRSHLVSDVPLGIFLSGGIDSSTLVALASRFRDRPLTTLSVAFDESAWSEARFARQVAERYGTDHREIVLGRREVFDAIPGVFSAMDEPTVDGVNTYFVARAARQAGLTVVLSGTGGDEVFLGYEHLRRARSLDRARAALAMLPGPLRHAAIALASRAGRASSRRGLDRLAYLRQPTPEHAYLLVRGLFSPGQVVDLLGIEGRELDGLGPLAPAVGGRPSGALLDSMTALEFTHYLQNQLLKDTDVMTMAHSVEARVPFLDSRLVEYVVGLPARLRLAGGRPKSLLLDAAGGELPREVWDRPKMGFTLPFEPWLREHSEELKAACVEQKTLRVAAVETVWRDFQAGRSHWSRPWALYVLSQLDVGRKRGTSCAA
jgi:asparagine synthase (glutamine-hydrolysing)